MSIKTLNEGDKRKQMIIASLLIACIAIITLEIYRIFTPLIILNDKNVQNIISIFTFILPPFLIDFLLLKNQRIIDNIYQSAKVSIISWFFFIVLSGLILIIRWRDSLNSLSNQLDYFIPLVALFFIFFVVAGISSSLIKSIIAMRGE